MSTTRTIFLLRLSALALAGSMVLPVNAATQVLYDASKAPNAQYNPTTPGWLASGLLFTSQTVTPTGTELAPTAGNSSYGGYSNHTSEIVFSPSFQVNTGPLVNSAFPDLNRNTGYSLTLGFHVDAESHSGNSNRAGFSITLIGDDLKGVEIGFQNDRIFAQETGPSFFTAAENTVDPLALGLLSSYRLWQLGVSGNTYTLSQGGTPILTGALRDYSAYTGLGQDAYRTSNFLFFGDNSSSAKANFGVSYAAITTAVPEPEVYALLLAGLGLLGGTALRRKRQG